MMDRTQQVSGATDAVLVLDTRRNERQLGARGLDFLERRMLFHAPKAHIELRLPPASSVAGEMPWLYGQFVDPDAEVAAQERVLVTLRSDQGMSHSVEASETGDFAMPCDPTAPFWLECLTPDGSVVRLRYEA